MPKFKYDILSNFQTMWFCYVLLCDYSILWRGNFSCLEFEERGGEFREFSAASVDMWKQFSPREDIYSSAQWDENRKSVRFQRRHLSWTRPFLKPQYLEILMLNQKLFKYGFNYNWTNLSEKNKTIFENRFLKGGKIGLKMGYFQVPILDSGHGWPRYWHISL